jgi:O-methyltransferase involved in polyketide biosynthesis
MNVSIPVKDKKEGEVIRRGLEDPEVRAMVVISGVMADLPQDAQARVLRFVQDRVATNPTNQTWEGKAEK